MRPEQLTTTICRRLILLASTRELRGLTGYFDRGRVRDPAGMITAARIDLPRLLAVLEQMLRAPQTAPGTGLLVPSGVDGPPPNRDARSRSTCITHGVSAGVGNRWRPRICWAPCFVDVGCGRSFSDLVCTRCVPTEINFC